jgi:hypothetical protein
MRGAALRSRCARGVFAFVLAASATLVSAQEIVTTQAADATVPPEIDRAIEIARVGEHMEKLFSLMFAKAPPEGADAIDRTEYDVLSRVFSRLSWNLLKGPWRVALAERVTPAQARVVIAFYESEPGRAQLACFRDAQTTRALAACENGIDGPHAEALDAYAASPEGEAFKRSMTQAVDVVMPEALGRVLGEDRALAAEVADLCRSRPRLLICDVQLPAQ